MHVELKGSLDTPTSSPDTAHTPHTPPAKPLNSIIKQNKQRSRNVMPVAQDNTREKVLNDIFTIHRKTTG